MRRRAKRRLRRRRICLSGGGRRVGSALAYRAIPMQTAYCGAKFAVRGFTDAVRAELLHERSSIRLSMVQLPAINTPQFSWVRNRLPRRVQPVPPVFQPEVAARAILWAAEHGPTELNVGWPTMLAILGQALAPGLMDRYVARFAWSGQMTEMPPDQGGPDNLWSPTPADVAAHGLFDGSARPAATQQILATHPAAVRAVAGLMAVAGLSWVARRRSS